MIAALIWALLLLAWVCGGYTAGRLVNTPDSPRRPIPQAGAMRLQLTYTGWKWA